MSKLLGFLNPEAILTDIDGTSRDEAIHALVDAVVRTGGVAEDKREAIIAEVMAREAKGSTGLGGGIALPHVKGTDNVTELCGAFAMSDAGVEFNAVDGKPVHALFLILSPKSELDEHITILRRISQIRENEYYLSSFRRADSREALAQLIGGLGGEA